MKKIISNEKIDVIEYKTDKKDIMNITLIEKAIIKDKKEDTKYLNSTFLKITDRKGNARVLDLINGIDITNMLKELEIVYNNKTTETTMFEGR